MVLCVINFLEVIVPFSHSGLICFNKVLTYHGFYDDNLEWVGLENIQIVASMSAGGTVGRHILTTRFTSVVRICTIE